MLALPYTLPIDTQTWGMIAFTKFFWEIFIDNKRRSRNPFGKSLGQIKGLWFTLDVSQFFWGFFGFKKTPMPFFKKFFWEIFGLKKSVFVGRFSCGCIIFICIMFYKIYK